MANVGTVAEVPTELLLAEGFNGVVCSHYKGAIPINEVAGGCAAFLAGYLVQTTPSQRAKILSSVVDAMLREFHEDHNADLEFALN